MIRRGYVNLSSGRVFMRESGSGPPVVFCHGAPDTGAVWRDVAMHLSRSFRCIVPDLPGLGRSAPMRDYSVAHRGEWIEELLAACNVREPVHLVGHSHGAVFTAGAAIRGSVAVGSLTLLGSLRYDDHWFARLSRVPVAGETAVWLLKRGFMRWAVEAEMRRGSPRLPREYVRSLHERQRGASARAIVRLYRHERRADLADAERRLFASLHRLPLLLVWGRRDPYDPVDEFPERARQMGARVHVFERAGHWTPVEEGEALSGVLHGFLRAAAA
ncbi:MAG: alpha/beta hydrolase [Acidobacteriota bacterium]